MKSSIYTIFIFLLTLGISFNAKAATPEQISNNINKLEALVSASQALAPLINKVGTTAKKVDLGKDLAALLGQLDPELSRIKQTGGAILTPHESLSGWKSAFFGLRYNTCSQLGKEIQAKRDNLSFIRVVTKRFVDAKKNSFNELCGGNEAKLFANGEIDKNISNVLMNLSAMGADFEKVDEYINFYKD